MMKAYIDANDFETLTSLSQHHIQNAFYKIRFSPVNNRGIHGGTASEMLHAILLGTFMMVRDVSFEQLGDISLCMLRILKAWQCFMDCILNDNPSETCQNAALLVEFEKAS